MRVLVIEDDAALNRILAKCLAEEGHSVDCWSSSSPCIMQQWRKRSSSLSVQ